MTKELDVLLRECSEHSHPDTAVYYETSQLLVFLPTLSLSLTRIRLS